MQTLFTALFNGNSVLMWSFIVLSTFGTAIVLLLLKHRDEAAVNRDWETLLSGKGEKLYLSIELRMQTELDLADMAYGEALAVRELGSMDEAIRLLDVGYKIIAKFAPSMMRLLTTMAQFTRMISAIAPIRPLRPRDFRLAQLASLAGLERLIHQFVVSAKERFRLKLYVLGRGFALASRYLLQSTEAIALKKPDAEKEWDQINAIRHDFQTLTDESMDSLRILLTSLAAAPPIDIDVNGGQFDSQPPAGGSAH